MVGSGNVFGFLQSQIIDQERFNLKKKRLCDIGSGEKTLDCGESNC